MWHQWRTRGQRSGSQGSRPHGTPAWLRQKKIITMCESSHSIKNADSSRRDDYTCICQPHWMGNRQHLDLNLNMVGYGFSPMHCHQAKIHYKPNVDPDLCHHLVTRPQWFKIHAGWQELSNMASDWLPIRSHIRKFLLTDMSFIMNLS